MNGGIVRLFAAAVIAQFAAIAADEVEIISPSIKYRSVVAWPATEEFVALARGFLGSPDVRVGAFVAYKTQRDRLLAGPRGTSHCSYAPWRALLNTSGFSGNQCPSVQEAIKIGGRIVVRTVTSECREMTRVMDEGADPLHLSIAGKEFSILHLTFSRPRGSENGDHILLGFYLRGLGRPSKEDAEAIATQLRSVTGAAYLSIRVRSDSWFLSDCGFPAVYAFDGRPKLPSAEEFSRTRYASCMVSGTWPIRCFESSSQAASDLDAGRSGTGK